MPRAIWSGSISFGLVNIPVKLYSAVKDMSVRFHMLHEVDGARVRQQLVCPADGKIVDRDELVKGYEIDPDQYVTVTRDELRDLAPKASRTIEILDFVGLSEIDPVYYQHPYYLVPEEKAARAYGLLLRSMTDSGRVGIGKFVMRDKEYLAAIRPVGGALILETMHFADEVVQVSDLEGEMPDQSEPGERELKMAGQLIDMLESSFDPGKYHDDYRESVMDLVNSKAEGKEYVMPPAAPEGKVIDIMAALEKSLQRARDSKAAGKKPAAKKKAAARKRAS
ncbi:MAG: non-homologous end joining protein Ku [Candidatus Geothermincolia bacterium]